MSSNELEQFARVLSRNDTLAYQAMFNTLIEGDINATRCIDYAKLLLNFARWDDAIILIKKALLADQRQCNQIESLIAHPQLHDQLVVKENIVSAARAIYPDNFSLYLALSVYFRDSEQYDKAERLLQNLIQQLPGNIRPFHRLASVYLRMLRYHDAIACCQLAMDIDPNNDYAHFNMGLAKLALNQLDDAFASFKRAVELNANNHHARLNLAQILLKLGHFELGWHYFASRWATYDGQPNNFSEYFPLWHKDFNSQQRILLWAEQGIGDCIMNLSLLERFAHHIGGMERIALMVYPKLESIIRRSFPSCATYPHTTQLDHSSLPQGVDCHLPLSDLAAVIIHGFDDFKPNRAYLRADNNQTKSVRQSLTSQFSGKKCIGFSWRGGIGSTGKHARCIDLSLWQPLLDNDHFQFINLQYDCQQSEIDWIDESGGYTPAIDLKGDMESVAQYLSALDMLVTADNTTAHLAGALGVPVITLLPLAGDWRWFVDDLSCWYPSMALIRQQQVGCWQQPMHELEQQLLAL